MNFPSQLKDINKINKSNMNTAMLHITNSSLVELFKKGIVKVDLEKLYAEEETLSNLPNPTDDEKARLATVQIFAKAKREHNAYVFNVMTTQPLLKLMNKATTGHTYSSRLTK
jgi:hypothetical protein